MQLKKKKVTVLFRQIFIKTQTFMRTQQRYRVIPDMILFYKNAVTAPPPPLKKQQQQQQQQQHH